MGNDRDTGFISRRRFIQYLAMLAVGGRAFLSSGDARAAIYAAREAGGSEPDWPKMSYRRLGRTNFDASRLVFGCGAALMFRRKDELLNGEIFYTLQEAQVITEQWRQHYNRFRPHSALDYRPPAPEAIEISPPGFIPLHLAAAQELTQGAVQ